MKEQKFFIPSLLCSQIEAQCNQEEVLKISFSAKKVAAIAEIQMSFSSEILGKDNEKDVQNENSILSRDG